MERRQLLAAGVLVAAASSVRGAGVMTEWKGAAQAPSIDLFTPSGNRLILSSLLGKAVLVNFWATWCEPCVAEMPSLQRLRDQLTPQLEVLGVNYQEGPARIQAFTDKAAITFPIVRDTDGAVAKAWGARIFPSSYLVDRQGKVRYALVGGADWTSASLLSTIRPLL